MNQEKADALYMNLAERVAQESYCVRKQVGAVLVTPSLVTLIGYNGTVSGSENVCEDVYGHTRRSVLHAETNALAKALTAGISTSGSTLYITTSPCIECAKLIKQAGIKRVVYKEHYRDMEGTQFLDNNGVETVWRGS